MKAIKIAAVAVAMMVSTASFAANVTGKVTNNVNAENIKQTTVLGGKNSVEVGNVSGKKSNVSGKLTNNVKLKNAKQTTVLGGKNEIRVGNVQ